MLIGLSSLLLKDSKPWQGNYLRNSPKFLSLLYRLFRCTDCQIPHVFLCWLMALPCPDGQIVGYCLTKPGQVAISFMCAYTFFWLNSFPLFFHPSFSMSCQAFLPPGASGLILWPRWVVLSGWQHRFGKLEGGSEVHGWLTSDIQALARFDLRSSHQALPPYQLLCCHQTLIADFSRYYLSSVITITCVWVF